MIVTVQRLEKTSQQTNSITISDEIEWEIVQKVELYLHKFT